MLALELGVTVAQVRRMSNPEWIQWHAFLRRKAERERRALAKAQRGRR